MQNDKREALVYGAFLADSYALGGHWIYDQDELASSSLDLNSLNAPLCEYHPGKKAGDFSHYGDQALWLLESLALEGEFSLASYGLRWKEYMGEYRGYIDGAAKDTYKALKSGKNFYECGSSSKDISVIGRIAPLVYIYSDDKAKLLEAVRLHTSFTHSKSLEESAIFFASVCFEVLHGKTIATAIDKEAENSTDEIKRYVILAKKSLQLPSKEALKELGISCSIHGAFPSVVHLLLNYSEDFSKAMRVNLLSGGDSCARGMIVGMILGAWLGMDGLDKKLLSKMSHYQQIKKHLKIIDG